MSVIEQNLFIKCDKCDEVPIDTGPISDFENNAIAKKEVLCKCGNKFTIKAIENDPYIEEVEDVPDNGYLLHVNDNEDIQVFDIGQNMPALMVTVSRPYNFRNDIEQGCKTAWAVLTVIALLVIFLNLDKIWGDSTYEN